MKHPDLTVERPASEAPVRLGVVVAVALLLAVLVVRHAGSVNGPEYCQWPWRRDIRTVRLWPLAALAVTPFFLAQWLYHSRRAAVGGCLGLMMLTTLCLELVFLATENWPDPLTRVVELVESGYTGSYFPSAARVEAAEMPVRQLLRRFPDLLPTFYLHARYKPPGLLLYYLGFIRAFGLGDTAALAGGLALGVLATVSVAATFWMVGRLTDDRDAAFVAASYFALCPSLVVFFPMFDQVYPILTCVLVVTWAAALRGGKRSAAILFGLALAFGLCLTWMFLFEGLFLGGLAALHVMEAGRSGRRAAVGRVVAQAAVAVATAVAVFVGLYVATGYNVVATFRACYALQQKILRDLARPTLVHVPFDVLDFALGLGWIGALLVASFFARGNGAYPARTHRLAILAVLQVAAMACFGVLPGETARLWALVIPLVLIPLARDLARRTQAARQVVYLCLWVLLVLLWQNMYFLTAAHATLKFPTTRDAQGHLHYSMPS